MVAGSGHAERNFRESENSSAIQIQVQIHAIKKIPFGISSKWLRGVDLNH